jgi:hypothetical protein
MTAFLKHEKNKITSFLNHEKKEGYNAIEETVNLLEGKKDKKATSPAEKVFVTAPANLLSGFQFMVESEDGKPFLVTVPHDVQKGEQFEVERTQKKLGDFYDDEEEDARHTRKKVLPARDDLLWKIACCCQAAPCCFPDGCCPDGCCPDGCCPNGNCGEQFEGMCFSYDFRKANALQAAMEGHYHDAKPGPGLQKILLALLDSGANPRLIVSGAQAALESAKTQQEANAKKNDHQHVNMADQSQQNKKKFEQQMSEVKSIHKATKDGAISAKVADLKIRKLFGLSTDSMSSKSAVEYPLGGCCNYAPCLFPDGCCPDGCCPDGCCPNGCIGEQFKGCCMSIKGNPPWNAPAALSFSAGNVGRINSSVAFVAMVDAIVNSKDASDEEICESLQGLLDSISDKDDKDVKHEHFHPAHEAFNDDTEGMKSFCAIM